MGGDAVYAIFPSVVCVCGLHSVGFARVGACVGDGARHEGLVCGMFQRIKVKV